MENLEEDFVENKSNDGGGGAEPCPPAEPGGGVPDAPYNLPGPQVEFEAAYWLVNPQLRTPTLEEVLSKLQGAIEAYPQDESTLADEIQEIKQLESKRDDHLPANYLSDFINLQKLPFGAIFNTTGAQYRVSNVNEQQRRIGRWPLEAIKTGRELARMFENETPGLLHRHALNFLLYRRADISPPRQARIWAALDMAIYAALSAAWYFKWGADRAVSFRQRPWEYDRSLTVVYDHCVNDLGNDNGGPKGCPCPTPGTPRHPAYPSGHSTYSAAASRLLTYFFRDSDSVKHLNRLADNIGEARIWAGVHWRTDHTFGQTVGNAVADLIIEQLQSDCVPRVSTDTCKAQMDMMPPTDAALSMAKDARQSPCPQPDNHDMIPPRGNTALENRAF